MITDVGGPVWGTSVVVATVILGIALVVGVILWSRRTKNPEARHVEREATERVYREAERQDRRELPS